ncbi:rhodanese-like domain-containing protein [Rhodothermus profundi]|uniref:Rhodanese-related sulfurtransferase n=1 Tax=Rhodothermus profundi TaxID=633813 RepID=A0A1M6RN93_9BACT|nr:rhodanese-like domain-containing protein [Rhodothermus profundi]SHK33925.1 Rhodanese-related sulfurtransferase [Rhodothermus profundi]
MWTRLFERLRPTPGHTRPDQLRPEVFLHRRRPEDVVIDVRTPEEFAQGHLKGARNLDVSAPDFPEKIARLRPDRTYYLYCRSGNRSEYATRLLRERGLEAYNIGSLKALVQAGAEIER